jgi:hypothetical protein
MAPPRTSKPSRPRAPKPPTTEIVVRRGALRRFDALKQKTEGLPVVITWDRRQGERRTASVATGTDRRSTDRRTTPPFTWELAEFVVVAPRPPLAAPAQPAGKKRSRRTATGR